MSEGPSQSPVLQTSKLKFSSNWPLVYLDESHWSEFDLDRSLKNWPKGCEPERLETANHSFSSTANAKGYLLVQCISHNVGEADFDLSLCSVCREIWSRKRDLNFDWNCSSVLATPALWKLVQVWNMKPRPLLFSVEIGSVSSISVLTMPCMNYIIHTD